jgi:hypothetical protein
MCTSCSAACSEKRLHARAEMLRARGLIGQDEMEDILIFRASRR